MACSSAAQKASICPRDAARERSGSPASGSPWLGRKTGESAGLLQDLTTHSQFMERERRAVARGWGRGRRVSD